MSRETEISGASSVEPADGGPWPARERLRLHGMLITTMLLGVVACVIIRPYWPDWLPLLSERWPYIKLEHLQWLPYLFALHVPILCALAFRYRWLCRGWLAASCAMAAGLAGMLSHILAQTCIRRWTFMSHSWHTLFLVYRRGPLLEGLLHAGVSLPWWVLFLRLCRNPVAPARRRLTPALGRRLRAAALACAAALLVLQVVSYAVWAERSMPVAPFRGRDAPLRAGFVCVAQETWGQLTAEQQVALERRLRDFAHTIYHDRRDIPSNKRVYVATRKGLPLSHLRGGSIWRWELRGIGPFWFTAHYGHWASLRGSRHTGATFVWFLGTWVHVWTHYSVVA